MLAKGQNCVHCAGDCCSVVTFIAGTDSLPRGDLMDCTVTELNALGYTEIYKPHVSCVAKTADGCLIYADRPRLCRSYFCHGKLWRPKSPHKIVDFEVTQSGQLRSGSLRVER